MILFAAHLQQHSPVPRTPTNTERVQAYRAIAPVEFWNARFQPHRQDEAAAARGALADGDFYLEVHRAE